MSAQTLRTRWRCPTCQHEATLEYEDRGVVAVAACIGRAHRQAFPGCPGVADDLQILSVAAGNVAEVSKLETPSGACEWSHWPQTWTTYVDFMGLHRDGYCLHDGRTIVLRGGKIMIRCVACWEEHVPTDQDLSRLRSLLGLTERAP